MESSLGILVVATIAHRGLRILVTVTRCNDEVSPGHQDHHDFSTVLETAPYYSEATRFLSAPYMQIMVALAGRPARGAAPVVAMASN